MKTFFTDIWQKEFIRNSTKLLSVNALGQLMAFLLLPVITRLYSQYDMGVLSLFLTVSGFLALFAGAKYEFAILLESNRRRAAAVFDLTVFIGLVFSVSLSVFLFFADEWLWGILHYESLIPYSQMIPLYLFLSSLGLALTYWWNYNKDFLRTAAYNLEQVCSNNILKVCFGLYAAGPLSLIAANQFSYLIGLLLTIRRRKIVGLFRFRCSLMKEMARVHRKFPRYYLPHTVVNFFSANLITLLLSSFFSLQTIGYFSVAIMLGLRPVGLVTNSLEQVLSQNLASRVGRREPVLQLVYKLALRTLGFGFPAFALLYFLLPVVINWYLDPVWAEVADYLRLLLPFLFMTLLCGPVSSVPSIVGLQGKALGIEIAMLAVRILVLMIGIRADSFLLALGLFSLASTLLLAGQYFWYISLIKRYERTL